MSDALRTATSALNAQQEAFSRTANNVANVHTKGYQAERSSFRSTDGGVTINPRKAPQAGNTNQESNVRLSTEIVDMIEIKHAHSTALEVVSTTEKMRQELLEIGRKSTRG